MKIVRIILSTIVLITQVNAIPDTDNSFKCKNVLLLLDTCKQSNALMEEKLTLMIQCAVVVLGLGALLMLVTWSCLAGIKEAGGNLKDVNLSNITLPDIDGKPNPNNASLVVIRAYLLLWLYTFNGNGYQYFPHIKYPPKSSDYECYSNSNCGTYDYCEDELLHLEQCQQHQMSIGWYCLIVDMIAVLSTIITVSSIIGYVYQKLAMRYRNVKVE